ncbi:hypothetical protein [Pelotomaculum sp. PtaB.Bin117]|uniref:hypothetical protein n=1 Tax=Pelotomaculum sp. PtaB.Bin117 TaxID=1811694 RepID=UPI0009CEA30E|nr:hypothetical protein [Pelotomaculum sp. PtaB.Bin117]OPX87543.1 MAG: hypothetical protein A4E54_01606 [Pelotomaculum sp. PtaB.Bin117]OPY60797.1 MAG: hypothetical protein A4E56_02481 [Pelotomaculum sp. PtaU1.Bin065]
MYQKRKNIYFTDEALKLLATAAKYTNDNQSQAIAESLKLFVEVKEGTIRKRIVDILGSDVADEKLDTLVEFFLRTR